MKTRHSLLAAATLILGLSAIGHANAANSAWNSATDAGAGRNPSASMAMQSAAASGDRSGGRYVARSDSDTNDTNAVTTRTPGSHNDGFRTSQGWWKDD